MQQSGRAAAEELGRAAAVAGRRLSRGFDEARRGGDLAVEVPGVERPSPHRLVDPPELGDGELLLAEGRAQRLILEFGPSPFHSVAQDAVMVEGELTSTVDEVVGR